MVTTKFDIGDNVVVKNMSLGICMIVEISKYSPWYKVIYKDNMNILHTEWLPEISLLEYKEIQ